MRVLTPRRARTANSNPTDIVDPEGLEEADAASGPEDLSAHWTGSGSSALLTRCIVLGFWACVVAGPLALLGLVAVGASSPATVTSPPARGDNRVDARAAVQAFAEDYVTTWLSTPRGQEKNLARFVSDASSVTLPQQPVRAANPSISGIRQVSSRVWSTTVAVTVRDPSGSASTRRYFEVPVLLDHGQLLAQTLPAPVAGPAMAASADLDYRYRADVTDPVAKAAGDFLTALLTGSSDVSPYTSPGALIDPILPPPYATVALEDVLVDQELTSADTSPATGTTVHVLVSATATSTTKQDLTVQYALTMRARDGRWEVKAIDPAPQTAPPVPGNAGSATPSPSDTN